MIYKFDLTETELKLLLGALGEIQAKHSFDLIVKLMMEQKKQDEAKAEGD